MPYAIAGARHRVVETNGVALSVYESGDAGPAVVFVHGFPELAYSWRAQLPAVAMAGFRAVAPDQRGYGGSSRPEAVDSYDIFHLTGDLVGLLDDVEIDQAVFVGHDWGGFVVWQMPLLHPDRVLGVVGVNTPYFPRLPMRPTKLFEMVDPNHYIVQFQQTGRPDAALARDPASLFAHLLRSGISPDELASSRTNAATDFFEAITGGPLLGEQLLSEAEMAVFVDTFSATGFTGGLNWYRNFDRNWELTPQLDGATIDVPSLMITAEWDPVLTPAMADLMVPYVPDLETHLIERCGHWTQQEQPDELNRILVDWLQRRFG